MFAFRKLIPAVLGALILALMAIAAPAQVTRLPLERVSPTTRAYAPIFDGVLVNWAFVNRISPQPVMAYRVFETPSGALLSLTVARADAMVTYILSEDAAGGGLRGTGVAQGYAGYYVVARMRADMSWDLNGEAWPFFGEAGQSGQVHFKLFNPHARPTRRLEMIHTYSIPVSTEGQRYETLILDSDGDQIGYSGGLTISQSVGTADSDEAIEFCQNYATAIANYASNTDTELFNAMTDFAFEEFGTVGLGVLGGFVGGLVTENPVGAGLAGAAGASIGEATTPYIADAVQIAAAELVWVSAYIGANLGCHDRLGALDTSWTLPPWVLTENPKFDIETPPPGAMLVMVCLEWSDEWEDFRQTGPGEYEVILHTSKCVRMQPTWQIMF